MNIERLYQKLEGIQTIETIMEILNVNRQTANNYISRLRKKGYVETKFKSRKKRIYYITKENRKGGKSYYEIINAYSPTKLVESKIYRIYGREPSLEETLVYAIKTKNIRVIIAALSLFKKIHNWTLLKKLVKANNVERQVGALYDLARQYIQIRKMSLKFRNSILPKKNDKYIFIIDKFKSDDFKEIEKKWKVYIPLNKADLEEYIR